MADKKISQLTGATTPLAGTEVLPIVQSGSTVKVSVDDLTKGKTVNATTFDTDVAAAGVTLSGTTLSADGTDTNIDINITPKGTGEVNLTKVDIDAGAIDGTAIGANSASTGAFTTLAASSDVSFDGGTFVFNDSGADKDFRIEGDTDANLFFADASTDRISVGSNSPGAKFSVTNSNATSPTLEFGGSQLREFVRTGSQSSDSTVRVDITFTSQSSQWCGQLVEISFAGAFGGSSTSKSGFVRYTLASLDSLADLTSLASDLSNITASAAVSGMELRVTFTASAGDIGGYCVYVRVLSSNTFGPATSVAIS